MGLYNNIMLSYIPLYVHTSPGYKEKSPDLQGTLELHMQFYYSISRSHRTSNENCHARYFLRAHSMATTKSMSQGKFMRGLGMCVLLASVASAPHSLAGFARVVSYTYVYLACIYTHCVACR